MGACASCLGLNRHPSQDVDETDPLLEAQQGQYAGAGSGHGHVSRPDEEGLRREREELENIAAEATDNMIDVLHPSTAEQFPRTSGHRLDDESGSAMNSPADPDDAAEDEEAAWLKSVQSAGIENMASIHGLQSGSLVMDTQLRDEPATSAAKRSLKARLLG